MDKTWSNRKIIVKPIGSSSGFLDETLKRGEDDLIYASCNGLFPSRNMRKVLWLIYRAGGESGPPTAAAASFYGKKSTRLLVSIVDDDGIGDDILEGIREFAQAQSIDSLEIQTTGVGFGRLKKWPGLDAIHETNVYIAHLDDGELLAKFSSNGRRNVRKALKNGVVPMHLELPQMLSGHGLVCESSVDRRKDRDEDVVSIDYVANAKAALEGGYCTIYQVGREEQVLASMLICRYRDFATYWSGGSSPEGMKIGASHALVLHIEEQLRDDSVRFFNMGLANTPGLQQYKKSLGTRELPFERGHYSWPSVAKSIQTAIRFPFRRYSVCD